MKTYLYIPFLLVLLGCLSVSERQDWMFVESCGGLTVRGQDKNPNYLNLSGDVSGLYEFSAKPTIQNSALAVKKVKSIIKPNEIQIYVTTCLISKKYNSSKIFGVKINGVLKGKNKVYYLNKNGSKHFLKEVNIY